MRDINRDSHGTWVRGSSATKRRGVGRVLRRAGATAALAAAVVLAGATALARPKVDRPTCVAAASAPNAAAAAQQVVTSDHRGKVARWTVQPINEEQKYKTTGKKASYVSVSLAAGAQRVFAASYDGHVLVWDLAAAGNNPAPIFDFSGHIPAGAQPWEIPEVWVVVPSADGRRALSAANDGTIIYWRIDATATEPAGEIRRFNVANNEWVAGLSFVPVPPPAGGSAPGPETQFVSSHEDGTVRVWNLAGGAAVKTFSHGNNKPVNSVVATVDGKVVSGSFDTTVCIWDIGGANNQMPDKFAGHTGWVWRVALSPDGTKVASASEDRTVRIFGLDGVGFKNMNGTGPLDAVLPAPEPDGIMGVTFVDNNTVVYTTGTSVGNEIKVWSIAGFAHP